MKAIKIDFNFENGKITEAGKYDPERSERATIIESIKFVLSYYISAHKLSGKINIEARDGRIYLEYDVEPKKFMKVLKAEMNERFAIIASS
jgi:hypothetical protein